MNARVQAWLVAQLVEHQLSNLHLCGRMYEMPPIMAFESIVDSSMVVPKLITDLFDRLTSASSELVRIEINRMIQVTKLFNVAAPINHHPHRPSPR